MAESIADSIVSWDKYKNVITALGTAYGGYEIWKKGRKTIQSRRSKNSTNTSATLDMRNRDGTSKIKHTSQDNYSMNTSFKNMGDLTGQPEKPSIFEKIKNNVGNIIENGIYNVKYNFLTNFMI